MPIPLAIAGLAALGAGLGYLAHRESRKAFERAASYLERKLPQQEILEDIKKYGLRQVLEKYGYDEVRRMLESVYRAQVSSVMARVGRELALAGVPSGSARQALTGRARRDLDIAFLAQQAGLPMDYLQILNNMLAQASQNELNRALALAGLYQSKPSAVQDIFAGALAGAQVGLGIYTAGLRNKGFNWWEIRPPARRIRLAPNE